MEGRDRTRQQIIDKLSTCIEKRTHAEITPIEAHAILDQITALDLFRGILQLSRSNAEICDRTKET